MKTSNLAGDDNLVKMTICPFQWYTRDAKKAVVSSWSDSCRVMRCAYEIFVSEIIDLGYVPNDKLNEYITNSVQFKHYMTLFTPVNSLRPSDAYMRQ